jgi:hypothetical protein
VTAKGEVGMKKILPVFVLCVIPIMVFAQNNFKFREIEWQSPQSKVISSEGKPDEIEEFTAFLGSYYDGIYVKYYTKEVAGYKTHLTCSFINNKFYAAQYDLYDIYTYNTSVPTY